MVVVATLGPRKVKVSASSIVLYKNPHVSTVAFVTVVKNRWDLMHRDRICCCDLTGTAKLEVKRNGKPFL